MAQRATSLGPKPSLFILLFLLFCFFLVLFFWLFNTEKKPCFPPKQGIFCLFSVFLFLSPLSPFGPPSFSVSLYLSLFFLLLFFLSFLLVFVFAFLWFLVFVPFLFLSLSSLLFFHERNNIKILNCKFFPEIISLFLFSVFFFLSSSFFLSLLFPHFKLCFLFNIKVFGFKTENLKKNIFWSKGGLQQNGFFFINLCFAKCQKLSFFFGHFFGNFWLMFKKHYKNRYFSTFLKAKK